MMTLRGVAMKDVAVWLPVIIQFLVLVLTILDAVK
jgi:hypothetical protein